MHTSPLYARTIKYELCGEEHTYDLMPDETYKSASRYLLHTYGDNESFYLTGEE